MSFDFSFGSSPFNELSATEQTLVREVAVRVQLAAGKSLLLQGSVPQHLWVLQAGHAQLEEDGRVQVIGAGEAVNWRAMLTERCHASVTALDDVQAWQVPKATLMTLLADNPRFSARVFAAIASHLADDEDINNNRELLSLMLVRVKDAYLQKPFYVEGQLDLVSVCKLLSEKKMTNALVRDVQGGTERIGMFTTTDLRDALLHPTPPAQLAVRDVARFDLITLPAEAELFDALLAMIRHHVHRVLVRDGDVILGVLSQLDLMSFVSNHSHLIALQVDRASSIEELQTAALQMDGLIGLLHDGGTRVELISRLVSELNRQIFARLWSLVAPVELIQNSCLVVMGSEGRGEQILKTDQDNALLLRDGYSCPELEPSVRRFNQALTAFGYPPCPGNIMVTNPLWCQPLAGFRDSIRQWLYGAEADGPMNLAIFMDARAVAGDASLIRQAKEYTYDILSGSDAFFARFVAAIEQFSEPGGWWARLATLRGRDEPDFDLKKLGTFPIVHGVRALALDHRLNEISTAARLRTLVSQNHLPQELARDLIETLHFLMELKLRNNLRQKQLGQSVDNLAQLSSLGTLDRDRLKDSLAIIKRFRQNLRLRYKLET